MLLLLLLLWQVVKWPVVAGRSPVLRERPIGGRSSSSNQVPGGARAGAEGVVGLMGKIISR